MRILRSRRLRSGQRGASVLVLAIALAGVLCAIDILFFNLSRALIIQRQIDEVCSAAAVAGTCSLAKADISDDDLHQQKFLAARDQAINVAENMLWHGYILNQQIDQGSSLKEISELGKGLKAGCCQYVIKLAGMDLQDNLNGQVISCSMAYGYHPVFLGDLLGDSYVITGSGIGGIPQIDSVLALDLSCSVDDETLVTFVRREWIHSPLGAGGFAHGSVNQGQHGCGIIQYVSLQCPSSPHTIANYLQLDYGKHPVNGCSVNALPPQDLDQADDTSSGLISHSLHFNAYLRAHYGRYTDKAHYQPWEAAGAPYFRAQDFGTPPGNCDLSVALGGNGDASTDLAGNQAFGQRACPPLNAFSDLVWEEDALTKIGYQPAAPGATQGAADNDPIPSPDQSTFTDLVVNITDPRKGSAKENNVSWTDTRNSLGTDQFARFTYTFPNDEPDLVLRNQTFDFANLAVLVEAARGNLELTPALPTGLNNAQMALIDRPVSVDGNIFDMRSVALKDGYQKAYQRLAMLSIQPLASVARAAGDQYFQKLHQFADCRFGLVGYSSAGPLKEHGNISLVSFGTESDAEVSPSCARSYYVYSSPNGDPALCPATYDCGSPTTAGVNNKPISGGMGTGFCVPRIQLDAHLDHYAEVLGKGSPSGIYDCRAQSLCDTSEALRTALNMFHSHAYDVKANAKNRNPVRKVIVLFINGEPTGGVDSSEAERTLHIAGQKGGSSSDETCESNGIAIFTIGLNLQEGKTHSNLEERQQKFLSDTSPGFGQPGGLSWRAGHGGRYYKCQNLEDVNAAFSDLAKQFSQCQK